MNRTPRKLDREAKRVALACSVLPAGQARWTLRLLQGKLAELEIMDSIGTETIRNTLTRTM